MGHQSPPELLVLHAVRLKGFADTAAIAARFVLDLDQTQEELLDAQAVGWVTRSAFADLVGWSLSEAGRRRNEAQLRDELDLVDARDRVAALHDEFLPFNTRATEAFTAWQLEPGFPDGVHRELSDLARALDDLERSLTTQLSRFGGYHDRFSAALARARHDPVWITGMEVDSCHRVWFELHEDFIATLGLRRGA